MAEIDDRHARFAALLAEHAGIVGKIAAVYTRGSDERRDLQQEIAAQVWRSFERFDPSIAKFSTWLYRIALNVGISHLRRQRTFEPLEEVAIEGERDPRIAELYARIRELDPLGRALVVLYLEDRSYAEIAEALGISEANVATKLHRIKHALKRGA